MFILDFIEEGFIIIIIIIIIIIKVK